MTIKLEAYERLQVTAKTTHSGKQLKELKALYESFSEEQKLWFMTSLPHIMANWFEGWYMSQMMGKGKVSDQLKLKAAKSEYFVTDALAVALAYLKPIFPVPVVPVLYRMTSMPLPKTTKVRVSTKNHKRPLTSWSTEANAEKAQRIVAWRHNMVLEWHNPKPNMVLASWQTCMQICSAAVALAAKVPPTMVRKDGARIKPVSAWNEALKMVGKKRYETQQEYIVYLRDKPIVCAWRPVDKRKIKD